jgi:acryloyl-coenzyme A reductase
MKAIVLHEIGPSENLRLEEKPKPAVEAGMVLVRVRAAGVCFRDVIDRRGGFPYLMLPRVPGHEFAGEVEEVGAEVSNVVAGDRVTNVHRAPCGECSYCKRGHEVRCERSPYSFGHTIDGGYAEYVLAPAACLVRVPEGIALERACFLACTAGVALRGLRTHGGVEAGMRVLITGASGGVGIHAIQVARALGASVSAVTSSEKKGEALRRAGADDVVVSADLAFHKDVRARTGGGVDVVLDCVGAPTLNASMRSVRPLGKVVVVGNVTAERAEVNAGLVILNEVAIVGSAGCTRADLTDVLAWVKDGRIEPVVQEVRPLAEAAAAQSTLESKGAVGRIVLAP